MARAQAKAGLIIRVEIRPRVGSRSPLRVLGLGLGVGRGVGVWPWPGLGIRDSLGTLRPSVTWIRLSPLPGLLHYITVVNAVHLYIINRTMPSRHPPVSSIAISHIIVYI